jgi:DNA-directed RNA polymerase subunit RPC12/RpoP
MRNGPLLKYYCSSCGKILSESSRQVQKEQLKEECPSCGALLSSTLQNMKLSPPLSQLQQGVTSSPPHQTHEYLSVEFQTAYSQIQDFDIRFVFDIKKIDSLANPCISKSGIPFCVCSVFCVHHLLSYHTYHISIVWQAYHQ